MKNRFVLLVDRASNPEQKAVSELLSSLSLPWWHYHQDSWLVVDLKGQWNSRLLLRKVLEALHPGQATPDRYLMVLYVVGDYWGVFPAESHKWLETYWTALG